MDSIAGGGRGPHARAVRTAAYTRYGWMERRVVTPAEHWTEAPADHDYPSARDYITLLLPEKRARTLVAQLRRAAITRRMAKDILRASDLELLPRDNVHVAADLAKVAAGTPLSPVLLVRGRVLSAAMPLIIADGYHRICASYWLDEDASIPCKLVG